MMTRLGAVKACTYEKTPFLQPARVARTGDSTSTTGSVGRRWRLGNYPLPLPLPTLVPGTRPRVPRAFFKISPMLGAALLKSATLT